MLAIGAVRHRMTFRTIYDVEWHVAILFLVALLVLSALVDKSGLFEWAALLAARRSRGSGHVLFRNVFVLGAVVTATLSLDTTAVLLTPVVLSFVRRLDVSARPYVVACAFVANAGSLALPISNLTNLILCAAFRIPFAAFVAHMVPVQLGVLLADVRVASVTTFAPELARVRAVARRGRPVDGDPASRLLRHDGRRPRLQRSWAISSRRSSGSSRTSSPSWARSPCSSFGRSAPGACASRHRRATSRGAWSRSSSASSSSCRASSSSGPRDGAGAASSSSMSPGGAIGRALATTGVTALASNAMNNLPAALVARARPLGALERAPGRLVYATLVGTNVGPNVVPFGSLATVLVLALARERGVRVSAWSFARAGLWTTPLVCVLASLAIALTDPLNATSRRESARVRELGSRRPSMGTSAVSISCVLRPAVHLAFFSAADSLDIQSPASCVLRPAVHLAPSARRRLARDRDGAACAVSRRSLPGVLRIARRRGDRCRATGGPRGRRSEPRQRCWERNRRGRRWSRRRATRASRRTAFRGPGAWPARRTVPRGPPRPAAPSRRTSGVAATRRRASAKARRGALAGRPVPACASDAETGGVRVPAHRAADRSR